MTSPDPLHDLAWLAAHLCGAAHGWVCLVGGASAGQVLADAAMAQPAALVVWPDAQGHAPWVGQALSVGAEVWGFAAVAVLRHPGGPPLGALCVADNAPRVLTDDQRRALAVLADQALAQLALRRLQPEGAALEPYLAQEWARHLRRNESLATLVMAVEGGAARADEVVSRLVADALRTSDHVVALGEMRLAAVLPGSGLGTAMAAAQRVRQAVERHGWGDAPVTLSLGVAAMLPAADGDPTQLRARAEHALQLAQRQGRNRVAAFSGW